LTIKKWLEVGKHNALSSKREERERERESLSLRKKFY